MVSEKTRTTKLVVRDVDEWIKREVFPNVDSAAFKKDDATLYPEAGPCTTCPKRTGASPLLFPDLQQKLANTCMLCGISLSCGVRLVLVEPGRLVSPEQGRTTCAWIALVNGGPARSEALRSRRRSAQGEAKGRPARRHRCGRSLEIARK
jgi:hypothetical protein